MIEIKKTLSEHIWGLDWKKHLPLSLGDYELCISSYEEFVDLKNVTDSFLITSDNSNDSFVKDINSPTKEAYLKFVVDFFSIKKNGLIVGVVICELQDWTSYYLRYITISKDHRSNNLTSLFVSAVEKVLNEYNVDKVCCDVAPSNLQQVSRMSQAGYVYTGNILSERYGAMVRLTKFLEPGAFEVFNRNFIQMFYSR